MKSFTTKGRCTVSIFLVEKPGILYVYDSAGKIYFFREIKGQERLKFNILKADTFTINAECHTIEILPLSIHPLKVVLPTPDRQLMKPFKIVFNPSLTGTPARNFYNKGLVEVGQKYIDQPYPIRVFILLHEEGHFLYADEINADLYAAKKFVAWGFNNSSAFYALKNVLNMRSDANQKRLLNLFKNLHR